VRRATHDFALVVEGEDLHDHPASRHVVVVQRDGVGSQQYIVQDELQRRRSGKRRLPVSADGFLPLEHPTGDSHPLHDDRRSHFEVVGIVGKYPVEIVGIADRYFEPPLCVGGNDA
jgi:hypothetical protein